MHVFVYVCVPVGHTLSVCKHVVSYFIMKSKDDAIMIHFEAWGGKAIQCGLNAYQAFDP